MDFVISLLPDSEIPLQTQIYNELRAAIASGRLRPGDRLPSTRDLAKTLGVARLTVNDSYERLLSEGLIETIRRSGTFVVPTLPESLLISKQTAQTAFTPDLSRYGRTVANTTGLNGPNNLSTTTALDVSEHNDLPTAEWRSALLRYCETADPETLDYTSDVLGYKTLREALTSYLARNRGVSCDSDQVIIFNGSQQALDTVARILTDPGDAVVLENTCSSDISTIFQSAGARLVPVASDAQGLRVDLLPDHQAKLVYLGTELSAERRQSMLQWAQAKRAFILEDDYNSLQSRLPALQGSDDAQSVIYIGTFSKVFAPSVRLGYAVVPQRFIPVLLAAKLAICRQSPSLPQRAMADLINDGTVEKRLRQLRKSFIRENVATSTSGGADKPAPQRQQTQLSLVIDKKATLPLRTQIYDEIRKQILSGLLGPGDRLPSTRDLSKQLGIARATVGESYEQLIKEGYIQVVTGLGAYVSSTLPDEWFLPTLPGIRAESAKNDAGVTRPSQVQLSHFGKTLLKHGRLKPEDEPEPYPFSLVYSRPALSEFPLKKWKRLVSKYAQLEGPELREYAHDAAGVKRLREAVAAHVSHFRAVKCTPDQVIITSGSQQALDLVARILVDPGDAIILEDPGFPGIQQICRSLDARILTVPVDDEGLVTSSLEQLSQEKPKLLYVTPSQQYPTGYVLPHKRRVELIWWAYKNNVVILEDDFDSEYRYVKLPLPSLQGIDQHGCVVYIGTFSKVLFPALRLGYAIVPPSLIAPIKAAKFLTDRHCSPMEQHVVADFIEEGHFETHIKAMRALYGARRKRLEDGLKSQLAEAVEICGENAGMHVMVRFHTRLPDEDLEQRALEHGVKLTNTAQFYLEQPRPPGEFVLGYSDLSFEQIDDAVTRLATALKS